MRPLAASALLALAVSSAAAHEGHDHAEPSASSADEATSLVRPFTVSPSYALQMAVWTLTLPCISALEDSRPVLGTVHQ